MTRFLTGLGLGALAFGCTWAGLGLKPYAADLGVIIGGVTAILAWCGAKKAAIAVINALTDL